MFCPLEFVSRYRDPQLTINPCAAGLFVSIFHSFEAGIADRISRFKRMKNNQIMLSLKNKHRSAKLNYLIS